MGAVVLPNRLRAGMSPAAVSSAIAAAIAAYAATDVGIRPLYSRTQAILPDEGAPFTSKFFFPAGTKHAVGAFKIERDGLIATATWSAWGQEATGEVLMSAVGEVGYGVSLDGSAGINQATGEWRVLILTTQLPAVGGTVTLDVWAVW